MRNGLVAFLALGAVLLAMPATSAAGDVGSLRASFEAGHIVFVHLEHNEIAAEVAAQDRDPPGTEPPGYVSPFVPGQKFCDDQVLGTWFWINGSRRDFADHITVAFFLDGVALDIERTQTKPAHRVNSFTGEKFVSWWFATGQPVIGKLPLGRHTLLVTGFAFQGTAFEVIDC